MKQDRHYNIKNFITFIREEGEVLPSSSNNLPANHTSDCTTVNQGIVFDLLSKKSSKSTKNKQKTSQNLKKK